MNRKQAIAQIKYAGYHGDTARGMRAYIENRISYQVYIETFALVHEPRRAECPAPVHNGKKLENPIMAQGIFIV